MRANDTYPLERSQSIYQMVERMGDTRCKQQSPKRCRTASSQDYLHARLLAGASLMPSGGTMSNPLERHPLPGLLRPATVQFAHL